MHPDPRLYARVASTVRVPRLRSPALPDWHEPGTLQRLSHPSPAAPIGGVVGAPSRAAVSCGQCSA